MKMDLRELIWSCCEFSLIFLVGRCGGSGGSCATVTDGDEQNWVELGHVGSYRCVLQLLVSHCSRGYSL